MGQNLNISKKKDRETETVRRKPQPQTGLGEAMAEKATSLSGRIQQNLNSTLAGHGQQNKKGSASH